MFQKNRIELHFPFIPFSVLPYSELFFYDKIFHWENLLFDFYFVNFLVVKKR